MSEEKDKGVKETIAEEAKGLAVEVYHDAVKPAASAIGATLGDAVEIALTPVDLIFAGAKRLLEPLKKRIKDGAATIPPERRLPPPPTIAAPAGMHYVLLGESEETAPLRAMFEKLLLTSMDRDTRSVAHPAFASMIAQLTPDEAWILKAVDRSEYIAMFMSFQTPDGPRPVGMRTSLGVGVGVDESRLPQYTSNLERLGIIKIESGRDAADRSDFPQLMRRLRDEFGDDLDKMGSQNRLLVVTDIGEQFLDACVRPRK